MKKKIYWVLLIMGWLIGAGFIYVGFILMIAGPFSRVDIDKATFADTQEGHVNLPRFLTSLLFGLIPVSIGGAIIYFSKRVVRFVLNAPLS